MKKKQQKHGIIQNKVIATIGLILLLFLVMIKFPININAIALVDTIRPENENNETVIFTVYGDIPYKASVSNYIKNGQKAEDTNVLEQLIEPTIKRRNDIPFAIHLGDVGRPEYACSQEWRNQTLNNWQNLEKPVVFTPGDNDWTDCDRVQLDPLTELAQIRSTFYGEYGLLYGKNGLCTANIFSLQCEFQPSQTLPELIQWSYNNIAFGSVHMVGSRNGWVDDDPVRQLEVKQRVEGMKKLLSNLQNTALTNNNAAVVVATQVDPFEGGECQGDYIELCNSLKELAQTVKVPVLFAHGDTNAYCFHKPFAHIDNLWRLNAAGDFKVIDANMVYFDPNNRDKPFTITGLLSGLEPPNECNYSRDEEEAIKYNRIGALVRQDFSDCKNNDVNTDGFKQDESLIGGYISVTQKSDNDSFTVSANITAGTPNTEYNLYLKCVQSLGKIQTDNNGIGEKTFTFDKNLVGETFAFDMYPNGAPTDNKYQSETITFGID